MGQDVSQQASDSSFDLYTSCICYGSYSWDEESSDVYTANIYLNNGEKAVLIFAV